MFEGFYETLVSFEVVQPNQLLHTNALALHTLLSFHDRIDVGVFHHLDVNLTLCVGAVHER